MIARRSLVAPLLRPQPAAEGVERMQNRAEHKSAPHEAGGALGRCVSEAAVGVCGEGPQSPGASLAFRRQDLPRGEPAGADGE